MNIRQQAAGILMFFLLMLPTAILAQYIGNRPLEQSFETTGFFFTPSFVNPYGLGSFGSASLITHDHPLIRVQKNPAGLDSFDADSLKGDLFYLDFRNARSLNTNRYGWVYPMYDRYTYGNMVGFGRYHTQSRSELTPLLSTSWMHRPGAFNGRMVIGASYQLILQSEPYYAIPMDIFKNVAGRTADGMSYMSSESYSITDTFSGSDEMFQQGHFLNVMASWRLSEKLSAGIRAGRTIFSRDGSMGSNNIWNRQFNYESYWRTSEEREQQYTHWDFSAGLQYHGSTDLIGLYAGYLNGGATQQMDRDDASMWKSGIRGSSSWSHYQSHYTSAQSWEQKGRNIYGGLQWQRGLREDLDFTLLLTMGQTYQQLTLASSIEYESENEYYHTSSSWQSEHEGYSILYDYREGSGERNIFNGQLHAGLNWTLDKGKNLRMGLIASLRNQLTKTAEKTDAFQENYYYYLYSGNESPYNHFFKSAEDKTIHWEFKSGLRTIQIPAIYEQGFGERFRMMLGINRVMSFWNLEQTTLILYDHRLIIQNDLMTNETMVGERIREPRERITDVSTHIMGGVHFLPSPKMDVHFIVSPSFHRHPVRDEYTTGIQLWLGLNLTL